MKDMKKANKSIQIYDDADDDDNNKRTKKSDQIPTRKNGQMCVFVFDTTISNAKPRKKETHHLPHKRKCV